MPKIAFFTTTRAEFGILSSFIRKINEDHDFESFLFVGGTHLKEEYGCTIEEIRSFDFEITDIFDYLETGDSSIALARSSGKCLTVCAELFEKYDFDFVCILGDRYELIPIVLNSILFNRPIIHFGGGETTEGAIDDKIRNMITQAAYIHFTSAEEYSKKIHKMGIPEKQIHTVGSPVIELIKNTPPIEKSKLFEELNLDPSKKTVLLTYHPVTVNQNISALNQIKNIFDALNDFDFQIVVTSPNLESERETIMNYIETMTSENENIHYFNSLGVKRYHSLIPHCDFVIGNSSSGLFEIPFFRVPTINVGARQNGRYLHHSVIQSDYDKQSIVTCINKTKESDFLEKIKSMEYKYGDGNASSKALIFLKKFISIRE